VLWSLLRFCRQQRWNDKTKTHDQYIIHFSCVLNYLSKDFFFLTLISKDVVKNEKRIFLVKKRKKRISEETRPTQNSDDKS